VSAVMSTAVRALRGATTVDADTREQITERVLTLLDEIFARNGVHHDDVISILFTATDDIHAMFPAEPARKYGLGDIPLICARELAIDGSTPMCIRVMLHLNTTRTRTELRHVYLEGAAGLRDDLPE
jgi:chorismate mutase